MRGRSYKLGPQLDTFLVCAATAVALNRAIATRYVDGPAAALAEVDAVTAALSSYRLFHATRAELLRDLGRLDEARTADMLALQLTVNVAERELLWRRLTGDA